MASKKIAILGSGAQGSGIGADMIRAGLDVTFIEQWPAHVEAMRARGVEVRLPLETVITPVTALHLCEVEPGQKEPRTFFRRGAGVAWVRLASD